MDGWFTAIVEFMKAGGSGNAGDQDLRHRKMTDDYMKRVASDPNASMPSPTDK